MSRLALAACLVVAGLSACSRKPESNGATEQSGPGLADTSVLERGARLYREQCAECHGPEAQGHPDWQTPNDGTFSAAPPLDGTGKVGHRTKQELLRTIKTGVRKDGFDVMPAYGRRLSDQEIEAVMTWFQSLWPSEVYEAWRKANGLLAPSS